MWRNLILFAWAVGHGGFLRWFAVTTVMVFIVLMIVFLFAVIGYYGHSPFVNITLRNSH